MNAVVVVAAAVLVAAVVLAVAWPFVSGVPEPPEEALSDDDRRRLALVERRDAAYAGLRELEADARAGRLSEEDYEAERARLRLEAGEALRELDRLGTMHDEVRPDPPPLRQED
jgi:hypothetical protein